MGTTGTRARATGARAMPWNGAGPAGMLATAGCMLAAASTATAGMVAGSGPGGLRITELRVDQQGSDTDEYFEIQGTAGASLAGCWLLAIGDSGTDPGGVVEAAINLSTWNLGANGRFVGHESTFGQTLFGGRALTFHPECAHAVVGTGDAINFENSDTVTYLLVRGFTGSLGADLDAGNDGTFDTTPWAELLDGVAFVRTNSTDPVYCDARVGPVKLTATGGMPPHAWLGEGGWVVGEYGSWDADTPGGGPAVPAPGAAATLAVAAAASGRRRRRAG